MEFATETNMVWNLEWYILRSVCAIDALRCPTARPLDERPAVDTLSLSASVRLKEHRGSITPDRVVSFRILSWQVLDHVHGAEEEAPLDLIL